jgi:eukaryotic-like serine/threonine-protein kinase
MSWRSRVRTSLVYLVSIVAGFALAYLVVAFVVFPAGVVPRDVKVPNVTGLMYDEAEQRLTQAGFKAEQGEQHYNNSSPKGTVLEQSPPPGAREGIGNTVTLVVSGGQRLTSVPVVTGMSREEAQAALEKAGFDLGDVTESPSNSAQGTVIATRPAAGSQVSVPSAINLVIAAPAATVDMPDLMGQNIDAARAMLQQMRVRNVQVVRDQSLVGPPGSVVGQSPVPNAPLPPGATVTLRVATEPVARPEPPAPAPVPVQTP